MATSSKAFARLALLLAVLAAAGANAAFGGDQDDARLVGAPLGQLVDMPSGGEAEAVTFDPRVAVALLALAPEEGLRIDEWPVAPAVRRTVFLTRHEIYSPDARIVKMDGDREVELPRSKLVFFWGSGAFGSVLVALDPDSRAFSGLATTDAG